MHQEPESDDISITPKFIGADAVHTPDIVVEDNNEKREEQQAKEKEVSKDSGNENKATKQSMLKHQEEINNVTTGELITRIQNLAAKGIFMEDVLRTSLRSNRPLQRTGKLWAKLQLTSLNNKKTEDNVEKAEKGPEEIITEIEKSVSESLKPDAELIRELTMSMSKKTNAAHDASIRNGS